MFATNATAQQEKSDSKYAEWLPSKGDFQIGFGLNPLTKYVGRMLTAGNDLDDLNGDPILDNFTFSGAAVQPLISVMGSYMLTDRFSVRANIGVDYSCINRRYIVQDDLALFLDPMSKAYVADMARAQRLNLSISGGVEYRIGKRNIQGIFGAGLVYGVNVMERNSYFYGNAITEANQAPTVAGDMPGYTTIAGYEYIPEARVLRQYADKGTHYVGVYGSAGVEWFVAPKVSLGANVNCLFDYAFQPSHMIEAEGWNVQTMKYEKFYKKADLLQDGFFFNTDNIGANLTINFYF